MKNKQYDRIIIGAGIYGLYAAIKSLEKGLSVLVIEKENAPFRRGSYINQARVHNGYHYPRSRSTAVKSRDYYQRFIDDYPEAINDRFRKVYAISKDFSWTNGEQFEKFCHDNEIPNIRIPEDLFFTKGTTDGVFDTVECAFDAEIISKSMMKRCESHEKFEIRFNQNLERVSQEKGLYYLHLEDDRVSTAYLLNATYASTNEILMMMGFEKLKIKYELCEVILCKVTSNVQNVGITVMDGPFFSLMPFGLTEYHSLTSVTFTPHETSYDDYPVFDFPAELPITEEEAKQYRRLPESAWPKMYNLAKKYLREDIEIEYVKSIFTIKPILTTTEIDDSRPTIIKQYSQNPSFITVFSGKINTIYDLDDVL